MPRDRDAHYDRWLACSSGQTAYSFEGSWFLKASKQGVAELGDGALFWNQGSQRHVKQPAAARLLLPNSVEALYFPTPATVRQSVNSSSRDRCRELEELLLIA